MWAHCSVSLGNRESGKSIPAEVFLACFDLRICLSGSWLLLCSHMGWYNGQSSVRVNFCLHWLMRVCREKLVCGAPQVLKPTTLISHIYKTWNHTFFFFSPFKSLFVALLRVCHLSWNHLGRHLFRLSCCLKMGFVVLEKIVCGPKQHYLIPMK